MHAATKWQSQTKGVKQLAQMKFNEDGETVAE